MRPADLSRFLTAEFRRWASEPLVLITVVAGPLISGLLTFAIVASSGSDAGTGPVTVQTETTLTQASGQTELHSLLSSGVALVLPICALVLGAGTTGREVSGGGLGILTVAARRLRPLLSVRAALMVAMAVGLGVLTAASATLGGALALRRSGLTHLSAADGFATLATGAVVQSAAIAGVAFGLALLFRRMALVIVALVVSVIVLEPVVSSVFSDVADWLPRSATSALMTADATDWWRVVPTVCLGAGLSLLAIGLTRNETAYR